MNILDLKKLMLVPLACCVFVQQTDAKVMYSSGATKDLQNAVNGNDGRSRINVPPGYVSLDGEVSDDPIEEKIKEMVKRMKQYGEYQMTTDDQMAGLAAFVPETGKGTGTGVRAYLGWKRKVGEGDVIKVPPNNPARPDDVMTLCAFSEYTHTERQLAACALFGAGTTGEAVTGSGDIKWMRKYAKSGERKKIKGDLYIYTSAPPCTHVSRKAPDNGGIYCTEYYGLLSEMFPNVKIHVYFETDKLRNLSTEALEGGALSSLVAAWSWAMRPGRVEKLRAALKEAGLSNRVEVKSDGESQSGRFSLEAKGKLSRVAENQARSLFAEQLMEFVDGVARDKTVWTPEQRKKILKSLFKTIIKCQRKELENHPFDNLEFDCIDTEN